MHTVFVKTSHDSRTRCLTLEDRISGLKLRKLIQNLVGPLAGQDCRLYCQNRKISEDTIINENDVIHVVGSIPGGKGGFGSMLRAIGAQIEKTTNREACRDLSGRRLRDINEEKRLKKWLSKQAEREKEKEEQKKRKHEQAFRPPVHHLDDKEFDAIRSSTTDKVHDAVTHGLKRAAAAGTSTKDDDAAAPGPSKKRTPTTKWTNLEVSDDSSDADDDSSNESGDENSKESGIEPSPEVPENMEEDQIVEQAAAKVEQQTVANITESDSKSSRNSEIKSGKNPDSSEDHNSSESSASNTSEEKSIPQQESIPQEELIPQLESIQPDCEQVTLSIDSIQKDEVDEIPFDLENSEKLEDLERFGRDRLKSELVARKMKCGGTTAELAARLWQVRGKTEIPKHLLAKK